MTHCRAPNLTVDTSRSASTAIAQPVLTYLARIATGGNRGNLLGCPELPRGTRRTVVCRGRQVMNEARE